LTVRDYLHSYANDLCYNVGVLGQTYW